MDIIDGDLLGTALTVDAAKNRVTFRSDQDGKTWTVPATKASGVLVQGRLVPVSHVQAGKRVEVTGVLNSHHEHLLDYSGLAQE